MITLVKNMKKNENQKELLKEKDYQIEQVIKEGEKYNSLYITLRKESSSKIEQLQKELDQVKQTTTINQTTKVDIKESTNKELQLQLNQQIKKYEDLLTVKDSELNQLKKSYKESELRNNELSSSIPQATQPLLRQIKTLNSSLSSAYNTIDINEQKYQQELEILQKNIQIYQEKSNEIEMNYNHLQHKYHVIQQKIDNLSEINEKIEIIKNLKYENDNLKHKIDKNMTLILFKDENILKLKKEIDMYLTTINQLKQQIKNDKKEESTKNDETVKTTTTEISSIKKSNEGKIDEKIDINPKNSIMFKTILIRNQKRQQQLEYELISIQKKYKEKVIQYDDIHQKYDTGLLLIGEKQQEIDHLKQELQYTLNDLQLVQETFKQQIEQLLPATATANE